MTGHRGDEDATIEPEHVTVRQRGHRRCSPDLSQERGLAEGIARPQGTDLSAVDRHAQGAAIHHIELVARRPLPNDVVAADDVL